jgi:hypothetical protein
MVKELCGIFEKEDGLVGLLKEAPKVFGINVTKELVYVIYSILHQKLGQFHKYLAAKEPLIPKFNCFVET